MRDLALLSIDSADDNEEQRLVSGLMLCNLQYWASTEDVSNRSSHVHDLSLTPFLLLSLERC